MSNPIQYQTYTSSSNAPQSLPCYIVPTWITNMSSPLQTPLMTFSDQRQNIPIVTTPTPGNVIILQSQSNQLPSMTDYQLPPAHYLLVRSQTNPNEFQIVSELTPATSLSQYIPSSSASLFPTWYSHGNALELQHYPEMQTNTPSVPHEIQFGDGHASVNSTSEMDPDEFYEVQRGSAFRNTLLYSDFRPRSQHHDLIGFLSKLANQIKLKILNLLNRFQGLKIWTSIEVEYTKQNDNKDVLTRYLNSKAETVFNDFELDEIVRKILEQIIERNANFIQIRSGLVLNKVKCAAIHVSKHVPLAGASYKPLPKFLQDKHAVINVQNTDDRCFGYSVLSMLQPCAIHAERPNNYNNFFLTRNLNQLNYPIEPRNVPKVEDTIQMNINIYGCSHEGVKRFPLYVSKKQYPICIDLLYWDGHYAWIKNFSALFSDVNKGEHKMLFCKRCLGHFISKESLANHQRNCQMAGFTSTIYTMPQPGAILKFKNVRYQQKLVFKIFADCESIIESGVSDGDNNRLHTPCAVGFKLVSLLPNYQIPYQSVVY